MLLVSRSSQAGDRKSAAAACAWLDRVAGLHVDPIVATKFWHSDCVFASRAPLPIWAVVTGPSCGCTPRKYHGKNVSVINDTNFSSCKLVYRVNGRNCCGRQAVD